MRQRVEAVVLDVQQVVVNRRVGGGGLGLGAGESGGREVDGVDLVPRLGQMAGEFTQPAADVQGVSAALGGRCVLGEQRAFGVTERAEGVAVGVVRVPCVGHGVLPAGW